MMKRYQCITQFITSGCFILPLVLIYEEIIFSILGLHSINIVGIITSLIIGFSLFLLVNYISKYSKKIAFLVIFLVVLIITILYVTELYIYKFFNTFMTVDMILNNTVNVAKNYMSKSSSIVIENVYIVVLYIIPLIALYLLRNKIFINIKNKHLLPLIALMIVLCVIPFHKVIINSNNDFYSMVYKNGLLNGLIFYKNTVDTEFTIEDDEINEETNIEKEVPIDESIDTISVKENKQISNYNAFAFDFEEINKKANNELVTKNNEYISHISPSKKNNYTGIFKGKNMILICAESFSIYGVTEKLTPTLYRLIHNGFYFSDAYMTTVTHSTTEGEYQLITGLSTGYGNDTMTKTIGKCNYCTLGSFSKRAGYNTACFHNGDYYYYNRNVTHEKIGYDVFLANNKGLSKFTNSYNTDYALFDKTLDLYMDKQPFSLYYMTNDCHLPYNKKTTNENYSALVRAYYGSNIEDDLCSYYSKMIGFDKALENVLDKLEKNGIINDTVIAFASDHYPYGLQRNESTSLYTLYGTEFSELDIDIRDKNGIVIWSGALENELKMYQKEISVPVNSLDILPTLLNLFGFEYDSRVFAGRDVFSDAEPLVFWGNESFITDKCFYNSVNGTIKSRDGSVIDEDYIKKRLSIIRNRTKYTYNVFLSDYFKYLFSVDDKNIEESSTSSDNMHEIVSFGNYYGEELEWLVLEKDVNGKALLLSKNIVDSIAYGAESWEESIIRQFANSTFISQAFNEIEQSKLLSDAVTNDKVFIFSKEDYMKYYGDGIDNASENLYLGVGATKYAIEKGLYRKNSPGKWYNGNGSYWLKQIKSPEYMYASTVEYNGHINNYGYVINSQYVGFRPAIWVLMD